MPQSAVLDFVATFKAAVVFMELVADPTKITMADQQEAARVLMAWHACTARLAVPFETPADEEMDTGDD